MLQTVTNQAMNGKERSGLRGVAMIVRLFTTAIFSGVVKVVQTKNLKFNVFDQF